MGSSERPLRSPPSPEPLRSPSSQRKAGPAERNAYGWWRFPTMLLPLPVGCGGKKNVHVTVSLYRLVQGLQQTLWNDAQQHIHAVMWPMEEPRQTERVEQRAIWWKLPSSEMNLEYNINIISLHFSWFYNRFTQKIQGSQKARNQWNSTSGLHHWYDSLFCL